MSTQEKQCQSMEMNRGIVTLMINKIYDENLPIGCRLGKVHCYDQSIAGFENKTYVQDVELFYEESEKETVRNLINDCVVEYSQL